MYNPRRNNEYTICGRQINTYFYLTRGRLGEKISPFKAHVLPTNQYEGEYHPICKIGIYPELNITESEVFNGTKLIYDLGSKNPDINNIEKLRDPVNLLITLITCEYHSLTKRLYYDHSSRALNVDPGHVRGAQFTIDALEKHLYILSKLIPVDYYECIYKDLVSYFGSLELMTEIYNRIMNKNVPGALEVYNDYVKFFTRRSRKRI